MKLAKMVFKDSVLLQKGQQDVAAFHSSIFIFAN